MQRRQHLHRAIAARARKLSVRRLLTANRFTNVDLALLPRSKARSTLGLHTCNLINCSSCSLPVSLALLVVPAPPAMLAWRMLENTCCFSRTIVRVHANDGAPRFKLAVIVFGIFVAKSPISQGAGNTTGHSTGRAAYQGCAQYASGDDRADTR